MSRNRDDRDDRNRGRSRHNTHRSKRDHTNTSLDSGYGGSAIAIPKLSREDAPRAYHVESSRHHHAKPSRRASPSQGHHSLDEKDGDYNKHNGSDSDTDYDPRDKYYIDVNDDEYENMSFRNGEASKDDRASKERRERRESDTSSVSRRSGHDLYRDKSTSFQRSDRASSTGSDPGDGRRKYSSRTSDVSSSRTDSRDRRGPASSRKPRSKASAASHSRHESNYRSLSPIPSEWGESDDASSPVRPRKASSQRRPRGNRSAKSTKAHDAAAGMIDPDGETANSFLQKLTKGINVKSVGRVGLDAAAVAAIKVAVGTRVPWQQRIPKTIAAGAAAAIMDFVVKKTSFQPKGMIGTIFARQFVEIILANLVVNPVSAKVTGAAQNLTGGGKIAVGSKGGGGRKGRR
ncbi:hypothetical protein VMCG_09296 [Cytospora schulzeri]|uniref:Uncharacterized protein n=1 Tax=Cytospora schulzeri TaxID=448051 RepID=A0A423VMF0_9PEZI|nr:hypothetical protein VMCG_09296 [Valsa malicola]